MTEIDNTTVRKEFHQKMNKEVWPHFRNILNHPLIKPSAPKRVLAALDDDECKKRIMAALALWLPIEAKRLYLVLREGQRPTQAQVSLACCSVPSTS